MRIVLHHGHDGWVRRLAAAVTAICFALSANAVEAMQPHGTFDAGRDRPVGMRLAATDGEPAHTTKMPDRISEDQAACASAYHDALSQIATDHSAPLKQAVKSVRRGWRTLPGRWLFPPGRLAHGTVLRNVVRKATTLVRYRGADPQLMKAVRTRAVTRSMIELDLYVRQADAPALCTGAPAYMSFFEERLATFGEQWGSAEDLFERAAQAADWALLDAAGTIETPPETEESANAEVWQEATAALDEVFDAARALWARIIDADAAPDALPGHIGRLADLRRQLAAINIYRLGPLQQRRAALNTALTAVEAQAYLQGSYGSYGRIAAGFSGMIAAVRSAHAANCTCPN